MDPQTQMKKVQRVSGDGGRREGLYLIVLAQAGFGGGWQPRPVFLPGKTPRDKGEPGGLPPYRSHRVRHA